MDITPSLVAQAFGIDFEDTSVELLEQWVQYRASFETGPLTEVDIEVIAGYVQELEGFDRALQLAQKEGAKVSHCELNKILDMAREWNNASTLDVEEMFDPKPHCVVQESFVSGGWKRSDDSRGTSFEHTHQYMIGGNGAS